MSKKLIYLSLFVLVLGLVVCVANADPYQQNPGSDGIVSMEAENFDENTPQGNHAWDFVTEPAGFSGTGAMRAMPHDNTNTNTGFETNCPRLDFKVNFVKSGTHYIWVRCRQIDDNTNTCHVGIDGTSYATSDRVGNLQIFNEWVWAGLSELDNNERLTINIPSLGVHTINVWMRESGYWFDKIVLTTNPNYTPTGEGPAESLRSPQKASEPSPADGATDVLREVVLSWKPGKYASPVNGHKIYLSENINDVKDGTACITQDSNSYAPPQRLNLSTTYYWRVDEVNGPPDYTVHKGNLWSFTTEPVGYPIKNITATASSSHQADTGPENTINGSGLDAGDLHSKEPLDMWLSSVAGPQPTWIKFQFDKVYKLHQMWVWNSNQVVEPFVGFGFKDVIIEYSTNGTDWTTLGGVTQFAQAPGADGYQHNTTVDFSGALARYVRLTANSNWGFLPQYGLSEVRFLYIPVYAREPKPDSGATDVNVDAVLSFRAGREAAQHNVYFSTDQQAVRDGTAPVTTVTKASYGPLSLDLGKTYYWKINEVNMAETPTTWEGDLWSFTTRQFLVVDDFESYNDLDTTDPASNRIFNTWIDGYGTTTNGSIVGYDVPPFAEKTIVHGGKQSIPFSYSNTAGKAYSEAERTFAVGQNWTKSGSQTLVLFFQGAAGNTGRLYVKVNGSKVVYGGDAGDIAKVQWKQWNIALASLGVNLQNITKLSVGIDGNGASGKLYFDDIRLYRLAP